MANTTNDLGASYLQSSILPIILKQKSSSSQADLPCSDDRRLDAETARACGKGKEAKIEDEEDFVDAMDIEEDDNGDEWVEVKAVGD